MTIRKAGGKGERVGLGLGLTALLLIAARAALAGVPNFVRVEGAPVEDGFVEELRLLEDSTKRGGRVVARVLVAGKMERLRVVADTEDGRDHAVRIVEVLLGGAVRRVGSGRG